MNDDAASRECRSPELLRVATSQLLVVDLQERLLPVIPARDALLQSVRLLLQGAEILNVPVSASEQYPQGLGGTVPEIVEWLPHRQEKVRFSAAAAITGASFSIEPDARFQVVLCGIETHVCVLQTAFDLTAAGWEVFVVADAVGSRHAQDHEIALQRLRDHGIRLVTTEMVLFEWCETAGTQTFKQISHLIKQRG